MCSKKTPGFFKDVIYKMSLEIINSSYVYKGFGIKPPTMLGIL